MSNEIRYWINICEAIDPEQIKLVRDHEESRSAYDSAKEDLRKSTGNQSAILANDHPASVQQRKTRAALDAYFSKPQYAVDRTIIDNEPDIKSSYSTSYKPRGGFTTDKVKKHLKTVTGLASRGSFGKLYDEKGNSSFAKEIRKFPSVEDFANHLYFHGTGGYVSGALKPSVILPNSTQFGGGYDERYSVISLSKSKEIASNFTGQSRSGRVYPVLLRRARRLFQ